MYNTNTHEHLNYSKQSGFTLIELIMTIVIGGLIMTLGVPSFSSFMKNNTLTTQANDFVSTVNIARMEAIKRKSNVVICKSSTGTGCGASTLGWEDGWIAFVDTDGDKTVDAGEDIISVKTALPDGTSLTSTATLTATPGTSNVAFYFDRNGRSSIAAGATGYLLLCDSRPGLSHAKAIHIEPIGRVETISSPSSDDTDSMTCT